MQIPAGTAVRFEPGEEKRVTLVAIGGNRVVHGINGLTDGALDSHSNMTGIYMSEATFVDARLIEADLKAGDLRQANLSGADLTGADLRYSNLEGVDLTGAKLHGTDLTGANLSRAKLKQADLLNADFSECKIIGADFSDAVHLNCSQIETALFEKDSVTFPNSVQITWLSETEYECRCSEE